MSGEWSDMYGEVVWAKCPPYEWWPCYVYDPDKIPDTSQEVRKKAAKVKGKQYTVYFYGDTSYSFTAPKNVVLYSEESTAKYANTKHPKKFIEQFEAGKKIAEAEYLLEKKDRVNFHLQGTGAMPLAAKKVANVLKKDRADELYFSESQTKPDGQYQDNSDTRESTNISRKRKRSPDNTAASGKKGRGRPRKRPLGGGEDENRAGSEECSEVGSDGDKEEDESSESDSYGAEAEDDDDGEDEVIIKPPRKSSLASGRRPSLPPGRSVDQSSSSAPAVSVSAASGNSFSGESLVDRLVRFGKILSFCCANGAAQQNLARIVKVFDKLDSVEVTLPVLLQSGIGKIVTELRKSADAVVSARAQALRTKWKAMVQNEGSDLPPSNASLPQPEAAAAAGPVQPMHTSDYKAETSAGQVQQLPADSQAVPTGAVPGSAALSASQNQTRGRAVRLLREAAAVAPSSVSMSSGELAFALEKATMEAFGAGQPRYFEFVTRYAMRLKSGSAALACDDASAIVSGFDFMSTDAVTSF